MPLTHFICPQNGASEPLAVCLECALHERNRTLRGQDVGHCHHPYPYLKMLASDGEHRANAGFSVTMANSCLRKAWLEARVDYPVRPDRMMPASKGTAWHHEMERHNRPDALCEVRLGFTLPSGRLITGQVDCYVPDPDHWINGLPVGPGARGGKLEDHKTKASGKSQPTYMDEGYLLQQNAYRLFIEQGCVVVDPGEQPDPPWLFKGAHIQGPVGKMTLFYSEHGTGGRAWVLPRLRDALVIDILEEAAAHWALGREGVIPPRFALAHAKHPFCGTYCPVLPECLQITQAKARQDDDDVPDHPLRQLKASDYGA